MKGNKKLIGKYWSLAVLMALVVSLCRPQLLLAQISTQGFQTYGIFGNRTLGQPLVPPRSTFANGFQTSASGSFLYLTRSSGLALAMPSQLPGISAPQPAVGIINSPAQTALNDTFSPQTTALGYYFLPTDSNSLQGVVPLPPGMTAAEVAGLLPQLLGTPPAVPAVANSIGARSGTGAPSVSRGAEIPVRSPELSERLTRIARSKGMLAGQGIDVYFSNNVAVVRGTVRTHGNGVLLANLLALEPEVQQIDNQLDVVGAGMSPQN